ncbi:17653_t:CDS:2, partial [Racocetra persica]
TISSNNKFLSGTALYHASDNEDIFREFTFKNFTGNAETLIIDFEKNSIILMIGRYVYHESIEYLCLIQTISISLSHPNSVYVSKDLSYAFFLLLFTAPAVTNFYKFNTSIERQSFMLSKKLYNPITGQKDIELDVIVSYTNPNGHYDLLKNSLKKSIISAIGKLKLNPTSKISHIISSEIKWSYVANEPKFLSQLLAKKAKSIKEFNNQLDIIEKQYTTINSQTSNKKRKVGLFFFGSKSSNEKAPTIDLTTLISQI